MAEETDLSRTEPASARRLQEARRAGDVPRSAEVSGWLILLAALGAMAWQAPRLIDALIMLIRSAFQQAGQPLTTVLGDPPLTDALIAALWALLPMLAAVFVAALLAPMLLSGWVYAPQMAQADLSRASPFKFVARLLSADAVFDAARTFLKVILGIAAVAWALSEGWMWQTPGGYGPDGGLQVAAARVGHGVIVLVGALALVAALDAGWRWWRYLQRHAMTWQEVVAEARESEVSPELRARIRSRQLQAGQGRSPVANTIDEVVG